MENLIFIFEELGEEKGFLPIKHFTVPRIGEIIYLSKDLLKEFNNVEDLRMLVDINQHYIVSNVIHEILEKEDVSGYWIKIFLKNENEKMKGLNGLKKEDFLFDFESIFYSDRDNEIISKVDEGLNQHIFEEKIFEVFNKHYLIFGELPKKGHRINIYEGALTLKIDFYESHEDYRRLYVGFKIKY